MTTGWKRSYKSSAVLSLNTHQKEKSSPRRAPMIKSNIVHDIVGHRCLCWQQAQRCTRSFSCKHVRDALAMCNVPGMFLFLYYVLRSVTINRRQRYYDVKTKMCWKQHETQGTQKWTAPCTHHRDLPCYYVRSCVRRQHNPMLQYKVHQWTTKRSFGHLFISPARGRPTT